jgi:hypothetical protein
MSSALHPCLDVLEMEGFFGRWFSRWMRSTAAVPLENLRIPTMDDLPCCRVLPNGLCHLPCLELLQICRALAIERVGLEFLQPQHDQHHTYQLAAVFPRLHKLTLTEMVEWKEWEWEENVQAML